jgi:hypothetical protein
VSLSELAALAQRHAVAVTVVLIVAAATAYTFKHSPPTYRESATVVLTAPGSGPYSTFGSSLVTTGEVVVDWMMGAQGQQQLHQDGVTDGFDIALVNYSNQEFPYYGAPYLTLSASADNLAATHRTFTTVMRIFGDYLAARQRQDGILPADRIGTKVIGDTGPLFQPGSRIRSFAGLAILTLVAAYLVLRFLDRYPIRPRSLLRYQPRGFPRAVARGPVAGPARRGTS